MHVLFFVLWTPVRGVRGVRGVLAKAPTGHEIGTFSGFLGLFSHSLVLYGDWGNDHAHHAHHAHPSQNPIYDYSLCSICCARSVRGVLGLCAVRAWSVRGRPLAVRGPCELPRTASPH